MGISLMQVISVRPGNNLFGVVEIINIISVLLATSLLFFIILLLRTFLRPDS